MINIQYNSTLIIVLLFVFVVIGGLIIFIQRYKAKSDNKDRNRNRNGFFDSDSIENSEKATVERNECHYNDNHPKANSNNNCHDHYSNKSVNRQADESDESPGLEISPHQQRISNLELENNELTRKIDELTRENNELTRENNELKKLLGKESVSITEGMQLEITMYASFPRSAGNCTYFSDLTDNRFDDSNFEFKISSASGKATFKPIDFMKIRNYDPAMVAVLTEGVKPNVASTVLKITSGTAHLEGKDWIIDNLAKINLG